MSDIDDLESTCPEITPHIETAQAAAGRRNSMKFRDRAREAAKNTVFVRMSPTEPSLPKLKFMEGKDD